MNYQTTIGRAPASDLAPVDPAVLRCRAMIARHPELRALCGNDPKTALWCAAVFAAQTGLALWAPQWGWGVVLAASYLVGPLLALAIYALVHESVHNLIFRKPLANRWIGLVTSLPNFFPSASSFRRFHLAHHSHCGDYDWDGDVPGLSERELVGTSPARKAIWLASMWLVQIGRAARIERIPVWDRWAVINVVLQGGYLAAIAVLGGPKALAYLFASSVFSIGLHPLGARWIQEHFPVFADQYTTSYYGPANALVFNAGLHVEHHDLPFIAWHRLPTVRWIAPEYYDGLGSVQSWTALLVRFIFDRRLTLERR